MTTKLFVMERSTGFFVYDQLGVRKFCGKTRDEAEAFVYGWKYEHELQKLKRLRDDVRSSLDWAGNTSERL